MIINNFWTVLIIAQIKMLAKICKKKLCCCAAWNSVKTPIKPEHYIVSSSYQDYLHGNPFRFELLVL